MNRKASAVWRGDLKAGKGSISTESGGKVLDEICGRQPIESVLRLIQDTWKS